MKNKKFAAILMAAAMIAGTLFLPVSPAEDLAVTASAAQKMKQTNLSADKLIGTWVCYDFSTSIKYTGGENYDPVKRNLKDTDDPCPAFRQIQIINSSNALVSFNLDDIGVTSRAKNFKINNNSIVNDTLKWKANYMTYSYGNETILLMEWNAGKSNDGVNKTYIYRKAKDVKPKRLKLSSLDGTWTCVDYCEFDISLCDYYDPQYPLCSQNLLYLRGAKIKGNTFKGYFGKNGAAPKPKNQLSMTADKIGKAKYYVYDVGGETYLYYQWITSKSDKQFYVLKKNTPAVPAASGKLSAADISPESLVGTWYCCDYSNSMKCSDGEQYDAGSLKIKNSDTFMPRIYQLQILNKDTAIASYNSVDIGLAPKTVNTRIISNTLSSGSWKATYKAYKSQSDVYLFVEWSIGGSDRDASGTYVYKQAKNPGTKRITVSNSAALDGVWKTIDCCDFDMALSDYYNPECPVSPDMPYIAGAKIKNGKFTTFYNSKNKITSDSSPKSISKDKIGTSPYYIFQTNNDVYIYLQTSNGSSKQFYVLKKVRLK